VWHHETTIEVRHYFFYVLKNVDIYNNKSVKFEHLIKHKRILTNIMNYLEKKFNKVINVICWRNSHPSEFVVLEQFIQFYK